MNTISTAARKDVQTDRGSKPTGPADLLAGIGEAPAGTQALPVEASQSSVERRIAELLSDVDGDEDYADHETQGRIAFLRGLGPHDNPYAESGPGWMQPEEAAEWNRGLGLEQRHAERGSLIGKTAVWKIRVYGPAKFAERSGSIAFISGNSAFTKDGHELRLADMVPAPDAVVGGSSWAVTSDERSAA